MTIKIGIPAWKADKTIGVSTNYLHFIYDKLEADPVILMPSTVLQEIDLLLLPGGADINPLEYGSIPGVYTQNPNVMLEYFDKHILPVYIDIGIPVVGICRGAQKLWTLCGGKLIQHYNGHTQSSYSEDLAHKLDFSQNYRHLSSRVNKVTSRHHQIMVGSPVDLDIIAIAAKESYKGENIVEIFRHKELPILGMQYHPESHDSGDMLSAELILETINEA